MEHLKTTRPRMFVLLVHSLVKPHVVLSFSSME